MPWLLLTFSVPTCFLNFLFLRERSTESKQEMNNPIPETKQIKRITEPPIKSSPENPIMAVTIVSIKK